MTIEVKPNFILITDIIDGHLVKEKYIGYSEIKAKKLFKSKYYATITRTQKRKARQG